MLFSFTGYATRTEYWCVLVASILFLLLTTWLPLVFLPLVFSAFSLSVILIIGLIVLYIWINLAVTVRRLRDAGLNVWWSCPYLGFYIYTANSEPTIISIVISIVLLVITIYWGCVPSIPRSNISRS